MYPKALCWRPRENEGDAQAAAQGADAVRDEGAEGVGGEGGTTTSPMGEGGEGAAEAPPQEEATQGGATTTRAAGEDAVGADGQKEEKRTAALSAEEAEAAEMEHLVQEAGGET